MRRAKPDIKRAFWIEVMEKLSANGDLYAPVPDILKDLCELFGFACGFIYTSNYTDVLTLMDRQAVYAENALPPMVNLRDYLGDMYEELARSRVIAAKAADGQSPLQARLFALFRAKSMVLVPVTDEDGRIFSIVGVVDRRGDSTPQAEDLQFMYSILSAVAHHVKLICYKERVEDSKKTLEDILDHTGIDIYVIDYQTYKILYVNESMAKPYGGKASMVGKVCWQTLYNDKTGQCDFCPQRKLTDERGNPTKVYSWDYQRPMDERWFRVLSGAFHWVDGRVAQVISSVDITENKHNEETIRQLAEFDALTGLPNRHRLVNDYARVAERGGGYILFLDLDGFKQVNDTLGHQAGDELLIQFAEMLQNSPYANIRCYRHGGDEFVILCMDENPANVRALCTYLTGELQKPWKLQKGEARCTGSIGATSYPVDATSIEDLLNMADMAMYEAKRAGKNTVRFYNQGVICTPEAYGSVAANA
ncbi:sensor domain-containing diguanylate cyclase [Oscillospiraceae bacterium OttesenSCG-928-F05]|nr:sensor domain-containing diguanylate cyclase [Oscillospiraceae bacterium OttesenSCG-928-F05]